MRMFTKLSFAVLSLATGLLAVAACGDDESNAVRDRDGGSTDGAANDAAVEAGPNTLACGVMVPSTYVSPNFSVNAKEALDLKEHFEELEDKMKTAEGTGTAAVTAAEIDAIFRASAPSLYSVATAAAQATVSGYITAFGEVAGAPPTKTWTPLDAEAEGGAATGGKYENANIFSATGVDLREAIAKTLLGGALYNYALGVAAGPQSEATIDKLVAIFGATTKFANRTDADAAPDEKDELIAEYASRRDNKALASAPLGPYRKVRNALLVAKAASTNVEKCRADLDSAMKIYFLEWEKATYLTAIFYLNASATNAQTMPVKGAAALHGFGEAIGFIQSFKGIPQDRRKITDAQIDSLQQRVGAATPYKLITDTNARIVAFNAAFNDIGAIYGLTPTEIEDAKKAY